ncbi:hypothetical protein BKI52_10060 [marine bacterium AO1-C]|nr:hypothetical protein BKI52_10060 [marine bacterium AO1-C]
MKNLVLYDIPDRVSQDLMEKLMQALSLNITNEVDILREEYKLGTILGKEHYAIIDPGSYGPILDREFDAPEIYKIFDSKFKRSTHKNFLFTEYPKTLNQLHFFEKLHQVNQANFYIVHITVSKDKIYQKMIKDIPNGVKRGFENIQNTPWGKEYFMKLYEVNNDKELEEYFKEQGEKAALEYSEFVEKRTQSIIELMRNHPMLVLDADISDEEIYKSVKGFWEKY